MSLIPKSLSFRTLIEWQLGDNILSKFICWGIGLVASIYYYYKWEGNESLENLAIGGMVVSIIGLVTGIISWII